MIMKGIGIWNIEESGPVKLKESDLALEKNLENWIENDPALLQNGLTIVGRQLYTEAGPLDLLALDPQGQWVVIELKTGILRRDVVAQVMDYASCISSMPFENLTREIEKYLASKDRSISISDLLHERGLSPEEQDDDRDVLMYIVGTDREPGLERMTSFLGEKYEVPITAVTFDVFELEDGEKILVREMIESELETTPAQSRRKYTVEKSIKYANRFSTGEKFQKLFDVAQELQLYPRPWDTSIMYTSPSNRRNTLFTVWGEPNKDGTLKVYIETAAFSMFYPIADETAQRFLGKSGFRSMDSKDIQEFIETLKALFNTISSEG
jgi:Holliday junction resolvase-like predicted endonuclease